MAIVDDLGAILVIALFYAYGLEGSALAVVGALLGLLILMRVGEMRRSCANLVVGVLLWAAVFRSGVHATVAGVILGFLTPSRAWFSLAAFNRTSRGLLLRVQSALTTGDREGAEVLMGEMEELSCGTESPLERTCGWSTPGPATSSCPCSPWPTPGLRSRPTPFRTPWPAG